MEALNDDNLRLGINEINPEYVNLEEIDSYQDKPKSIVKMNGLVPFVAKRLPFDKSQEETLYEMCLKYANLHVNKDCQCPERRDKETVQTHPIRRFSKYLDETRRVKPSIESITLSEHVMNTKALEKYKMGDDQIEIFETGKALKQLTGPDMMGVNNNEDREDKENDIKGNKNMEEDNEDQIEDHKGDYGDDQDKEGDFKKDNQVRSSLDNFEEKKVNLTSFKLPRSFTNLKSPFSDFVRKKRVKKVKEKFVYKCRLNEGEESRESKFNLVLGKRSFDKVTSEGTYSPWHFTSI